MPRTRLIPEEARRALYIDFEGRKGAPPVLLGCTRRSRLRGGDGVWQAVTEERLRPLAEADRLETLSVVAAVERILERAEKRNRLIVAWSEHELDVVREYAPELAARFEARFRNARDLAERWRNKCHYGVRPASGSLADYLQLAGYEVPERAGKGRVGETVRVLLDVLGRGRRVSDITDRQLQRWDDLREHNRHDCAGMRFVTVMAAEEIDALDRRRRRRVEQTMTRMPRAKADLRVA